ncbi:hypothetical protein Dimus_018492 [Dionaea muscipula]
MHGFMHEEGIIPSSASLSSALWLNAWPDGELDLSVRMRSSTPVGLIFMISMGAQPPYPELGHRGARPSGLIVELGFPSACLACYVSSTSDSSCSAHGFREMGSLW